MEDHERADGRIDAPHLAIDPLVGRHLGLGAQHLTDAHGASKPIRRVEEQADRVRAAELHGSRLLSKWHEQLLRQAPIDERPHARHIDHLENSDLAERQPRLFDRRDGAILRVQVNEHGDSVAFLRVLLDLRAWKEDGLVLVDGEERALGTEALDGERRGVPEELPNGWLHPVILRYRLTMQPYRSPAPVPKPSVSFGDMGRRALWIAASLGLIIVTIAAIVLWLTTGGRIHGSVLIPALVGIGLLFLSSGKFVFLLDNKSAEALEAPRLAIGAFLNEHGIFTARTSGP
jgi:hypothetical protein